MHYRDHHGSLPTASEDNVNKLFGVRDSLFAQKGLEKSALPDDSVVYVVDHLHLILM